jgi:hypothetical protein
MGSEKFGSPPTNTLREQFSGPEMFNVYCLSVEVPFTHA